MMELATFGGGCFWCLEAVFEQVAGVESVVSGYAGGDADTANYEQVCSGQTGHAEVVQLRYDPNQVSYRQLLDVFFAIHDPTTVDRQGNDVGRQYRSVIYSHSADQAATAAEYIAALDAAKVFAAPVVTQLEVALVFYPAEPYHQQYFRRNPGQGYCAFVVAPKVAKFRHHFGGLLARDLV